MNLINFKYVVKYQLQSRSINHYFTPTQNVINAVKEYNILRANAAKKLANDIKNIELIHALRNGNKILQLDAVPNQCKCAISKNNIMVQQGVTIIIYIQEKPNIFCICQRFLSKVFNYYNIVQFDREIYKLFNIWVLKHFTSMDCINNKNVDNMCDKFMKYNNHSKVNLLYVKFNTICDL